MRSIPRSLTCQWSVIDGVVLGSVPYTSEGVSSNEWLRGRLCQTGVSDHSNHTLLELLLSFEFAQVESMQKGKVDLKPGKNPSKVPNFTP